MIAICTSLFTQVQKDQPLKMNAAFTSHSAGLGAAGFSVLRGNWYTQVASRRVIQAERRVSTLVGTECL